MCNMHKMFCFSRRLFVYIPCIYLCLGIYYVILYSYNEKYFSDNRISYSLCLNLEGIKDALCYKFRRPTIGQNCTAMCTNKGGHRDAFLNVNSAKHHAFQEACSAGH